MGYSNTEDLRCIVLCWPVLSAIVQIQQNPKYTNASGAFKILNDDLESYKNIPDPAAAFPPTGSKAQQKIMANKRLAAILSKMIEDLANMSTLDEKENKKRQKAALVSYKGAFPDHSNVPFLSPSKCAVPTLGPWDNEQKLEPHNRCWILTKYFKYCQQLGTNTFENRFPADGNIKGAKVSPSMIPAWMRPKPKTADPKAGKSDAMLRADALSKKTFTMIYNPRFDNPDSRDDVEDHFDGATAEGIERMVTARQDFLIDPRLYYSLSSLRDQLRRQLRCHIFRLDFATVLLKYQRKETDGTFPQSADLLNSDWTEIQPILNDEANDNFDFQVGFTTRSYEGTENIFEGLLNIPSHSRANS